MNAWIILPILLAGSFGLALGAEARTEVYPPEDRPTACTMQYQPVCGGKQVQCIKAPCYPQYHTYGNACTLGQDDATFIHEGECTETETGPVKPTEYVPPANCTAWFDGCNQCGRGENGQSFCTLRACMNEPTPGYCMAYEKASPPTEEQPAPISMVEDVSVAQSLGFFSSLWERIRAFFTWF